MRAPSRAPRSIFFTVLAALFACAGVFHFIAIFTGWGGVAPVHHATFVAINAVFAGLTLTRPPGFAIVFALLCGQQLVSHGGELVHAWRDEARVDWRSLGVIVVMPVALVVVVSDARKRRGERAGEKGEG